MEKMTRRGVLVLASGTGLAAFAGVTEATAGEGTAAPEAELFAMGPFPLSDWFAEPKGKPSFRNLRQLDTAPGDAELVRAFNECKLFVLDRRLIKDPKAPRFDERSHPILVASGKTLHTWEERDKRFSIVVAELTADVDTLRTRSFPPVKSVILGVSLRVDGAAGAATADGIYCTSKELTYDVFGREAKLKGV